MSRYIPFCIKAVLIAFILCCTATAEVYPVGENKTYGKISDVPLESLAAGDSVKIHYRPEPYREKWVIAASGTKSAPIVFYGVPSNDGTLPVIDGRNATTRRQLDYWNEPRSVVKIGGSSTPSQHPEYIVIENLSIRSARPPYTFTDDAGNSGSYAKNAAAVHLEEGSNITIRNCTLHDCGNGFFSSHAASTVTVEYCTIYDNGIEGSYYEHNNYTEANGIVFQFNYFGYLRTGCGGNNLKDRSGGCIIRYNWIEGGNRQLDLVDSDYESIYGELSYRTTYVYGNILIEPEGHGNSQVVHYGGDSGELERYRKGILHFYNNTIISTREGNTTLLRCSSDEETADVRNNLIYTTASGNHLAISASDGSIQLRNNWLKTGWRLSHSNQSADVRDIADNIEDENPGFAAFEASDYSLNGTSACRDAAATLHEQCTAHPVLYEYMMHCASRTRVQNAVSDIGAYEFGSNARHYPYRTSGKTYITPALFNGTSVIVTTNNPHNTFIALYSIAGEFINNITATQRDASTAVFPIATTPLPRGRYIAHVRNGSAADDTYHIFTLVR